MDDFTIEELAAIDREALAYAAVIRMAHVSGDPRSGSDVTILFQSESERFAYLAALPSSAMAGENPHFIPMSPNIDWDLVVAALSPLKPAIAKGVCLTTCAHCGAELLPPE